MLWQAVDEVVDAIVDAPDRTVAELVNTRGFARTPEGWQDAVEQIVRTTGPDHPDGSTAQRHRFWLGLAMQRLRGRVAADDVAGAVSEAAGRRETT